MDYKNIKILHEDKDIIVLNKPYGLTVHPGAGHESKTLVSFLLQHCSKKNLSNLSGNDRPGIIHRLDKDTSGLMLVAKNNTAHANLQNQFKEKKINRLYLALVWGLLKEKTGKYISNIGRNPKNRKKFSILEKGGKIAITYFNVKQNFSNIASLIECKLLTGRTHQIRVHLSSSGNSLIGDQKYGKKKIKLLKNVDKSIKKRLISFKRQALHAYFLGFIHPTKKTTLSYNTKLPSDINKLLLLLKSI